VITHPEKVLFSADGITKGELAAYYERVAAVMVPHLAGRPVTMERYPAGIDRKGFIQKDVVKGFPEWLERVEVPKKGGTSHYALVNDARSLLWTVNQNSITPHVWTSRLPALDKPDLLVVDLDPEKGDLEPLLRAALLVRDLLAELGLESWVKTSGSKGFHIAVPLDGTASFETVWRFSHGLGAVLVKQNPDELTQEFIKADRGERLFVDTGRNAYGATFAAPYAVRARPGASVSAPCTWQEIERGAVTPRSFTLRTLPARLAETGDLWLTLKGKAQSLDAALRDLEARLTESEWEESLAARTRRPTSRKKSPHETKRR
jgi:bifunctional non-homologous end joining protein LigD